MSIQAGNKTFKSKSTLINYCKYILNNADPALHLSGEWEMVMQDVLRMHERFLDKTKGMDCKIGIRPCDVNPRNNQFYIERPDGTDTDFSYYKAIGSKSKLSRVKETLRAYVREQVEEYKSEFFKENQDSKKYVICPETGLKIKSKDAHIDHYPLQFDELVAMWVDTVGIGSEDIVLIPPEKDNTTFWEMENKDLVHSWQVFHYQNAEYRIVLDKVNLQRKRAKRATF